MTEVDVMAKQENEKQLAHVLLLLVTVQRFVAFELAPNVGQLLIDALDFGLFTFAYKGTRYR